MTSEDMFLIHLQYFGASCKFGKSFVLNIISSFVINIAVVSPIDVCVCLHIIQGTYILQRLRDPCC